MTDDTTPLRLAEFRLGLLSPEEAGAVEAALAAHPDAAALLAEADALLAALADELGLARPRPTAAPTAARAR